MGQKREAGCATRESPGRPMDRDSRFLQMASRVAPHRLHGFLIWRRRVPLYVLWARDPFWAITETNYFLAKSVRGFVAGGCKAQQTDYSVENIDIRRSKQHLHQQWMIPAVTLFRVHGGSYYTVIFLHIGFSQKYFGRNFYKLCGGQ